MDFKSLGKLESLPPSSLANQPGANDRLLVVVRMHPGAPIPPYLTPRAKFGEDMFTAELPSSELARLEADPDVASMSISQKLQMTK